MLADAMQRNPANRGLTTTADTTGKTYQYQSGLWARQFTSADNPVFTSPVYVPFMSGFGGITAAMQPNGATYYYFSDNNEFGWSAAAAQAYKLPATGGGGRRLLGNDGFETGTAPPWRADDKVASDNTREVPHSGTRFAFIGIKADGR